MPRFAFAFDDRLRAPARLFGVTPERAWVDLDAAGLSVRFGPWYLETPLHNIESATITGPYRWWKVAGPAHLSLADRGVTFATSTEAGVCLRFREPVPAIDPWHRLRHPGATVTVDAPPALIDALRA